MDKLQVRCHKPTGDIYVVRLNNAGRLDQANGPLFYADLARFVTEGFFTDADLVDWINSNPSEFQLVLDSDQVQELSIQLATIRSVFSRRLLTMNTYQAALAVLNQE